MENKIIFGYDVMTYNGELPNCLNPKFISTIHTASDFDYSMSGAFFSKRWNCDWPVYNSNFFERLITKKSVYEISQDRKDGKKYDWFYLIEPFGSLEQFFGNHPIHEFALHNMSKKSIDEIKNGNGKLLIHYTIDGGLGVNLENFEKIIKFTKDNGIPDEKVYFIFSDFKLKNNLEKLGLGYKVYDYNLNMISKAQEFYNTIHNPNYRYWGDNANEPQVGRITSNKSNIVSKDEFINSIGTDKKDFLMLNRHWKLHRLLLMSQLYKLGIDKSLVSWDNRFYHQNVVDEMLIHDRNDEFVEKIKTSSQLIDIEDLTKIAGYGFETKEIYLQTYMSLVTESIFFQSKGEYDIFVNFPTGYVSEKIWKPIGHCQPFILAGPAKTLQYIRERFGFKTFSPYIDESYDLECDDFARLRLIQKEIDKFSNKTKEEKDQFLNSVKDICIHNQTIFLEYALKSWKPILENEEMFKIINFLIDDKKTLI
jgi:hypothetical protein